MVKKTSVTQIPMYPYNYYDRATNQWVYTNMLRHADFDGERIWERNLTTTGPAVVVPPVMIDNVPFKPLFMVYDGYYRGRSAAGMRFKDENEIPYTVFLTDFEKMIFFMEKGVIRNQTFIYCKRGRSYGVKLYDF